MTRAKAVFGLLLLSVALMFVVASVSAAGDQFRRWLDDGKTVTCSTGSTIVFSNQNVEFANLPADAQFTITYLTNGVVVQTDGPYTVEQTSGTRNYAAFAGFVPSFPGSTGIQLDTIIAGKVVYRSTMTGTCTANGPGTISIVNVVPGAVALCSHPLASGAVQGRMLRTESALFEPRSDAVTNIVIPGGSAWFINSAQAGFYQLWIGCDANLVWVPSDSMGPNFDPPWNGTSLPSAG